MFSHKILTVGITIVTAMVLSIVELPHSIAAFRPNFITLIVIFWCYQQPRSVGVTIAFIVGVLTDAMFFGVLGQHALAMVVVAFLAGKMYKVPLISRTNVYLTTGLVFGLLILDSVIVRAVNIFAIGHSGVDALWPGAFSGAMLWFVLAFYLYLKDQSQLNYAG